MAKKQRQMTVPLFRPSLGTEELRGIKEIFKTGWIGLGPKTAELERQFGAYIGTKHAIALNSCTAALHLALGVHNFPKGSEVLLPTINFISSPHSVLYNGLTPVFVDTDPTTLCMDVADAAKKVTSKTKAIIATHLGGNAADMDAVMKLAKKHQLIVIEDVANAVGGSYKGKKLGSIGHIGCHSFEAKKNMTTGDGGMLTLNDDKQAETLRRLRWLGINKDTWKRFSDKKGNYSWYYEVSELGYKYNMNDIAAVIGLAQLKKLDKMCAQKDRLIGRYNRELAKLNWIDTSFVQPGKGNAYWLYIVKMKNRDEFIQYMSDHGITTGVHFMPMHMHPLYKKARAQTPVADEAWKDIVSLPLFSSMTTAQQGYVIDTIKKFK
jgi:perosamine synthetase